MTKTQILIVEADAIAAMDIESQVKRLGYGVTGMVAYGEDAIKKVKENRPDLVLMDIVLKGEMDGIEAADIIRSRFGIPVIFLADFADEKRLERAKLIAPFGYILKPFEGKDLKVTIQMALYANKVDAERKRVEEAIKDEAIRRRILVEESRDGIVVLDQNGKVYEANHRYADMLGYSMEEVHQLHVWDWDTQWTQNKLMEMVRTVDETGDQFETRHRRKDGTFYDVEISTNGAVCAGQKLIFCVCRDVTARKQAEEALRKSEAILKEAQQLAHIGHWELNISTMIPKWSEEVFRIFGLDPEEGEPSFAMHQKITHPDDWDLLNNAVTTAITVGTPFNIEFRILQPDNTIGWMHAIGHITTDSTGNTIGVFGTAQDITERKQAEEALRESEEKYRSLVEFNKDSIYLIDENLRYLFANEKHLSRFSLPTDRIIGRKYEEFHSKEETKSFAEKIQTVFENGKSLSYECQSEKDGRYFIRTLSPVKDKDGRTMSVTVISKDITKRKQAEEAVQISTENLLEGYNQRKILSKRLIDLLEKDRHYIAMELHDNIGQVLTSLKINLEIIDDKLKPTDTELGSLIKTARRRAKQAIEDLNIIAHGLMPGILDALGLVSSLRTLLDEFKEHTDLKIDFFNRNVRKRFDLEKELAIYRIVQEALNNIIKHAKAKNVYVSLLKKDNVLFLSVEDDGVGFDQDKAMKISKGKGPLGLVIMRERAMQLDGELTIESFLGKGTHLLVEIPV